VSYSEKLTMLPFRIPATKAGIQMIGSIARSLNQTAMFVESSNGIVLEHYAPLMSPGTDIIVTFHVGVRVLKNVPCSYYLSMKSRFLRELEPVQEVQHVVDTVWKNYFDGFMVVGVHIRLHDPVYDWAVAPPTQAIYSEGSFYSEAVKSDLTADKFGDGAGVDDFIRVLRGIEENFMVGECDTSGKCSTRPVVRIFIASNSMDAKHSVIKEFPSSAVSLNLTYERNSTVGMQMALVEWLLLSKCDLIINSYGSSFAAEAAIAGHSIPLLGITNGQLALVNTAYLPFCGIMLFHAAYSRKTKRGSYREGTKDQRIVDGGAVIMEKCDLLSNWGIREIIYCARHT
jgi:hypothetical protein